ncbi:hypothetical protein I3760_05G127900 [Carya illinoinensis]|uniref:FAR1 domain-containing protein n=1 Tax=Carya illinoinensis TaxID=32201 RepID=A0A922F089_CARIL|nr:protein FAR1-RELATED SEQUENCE 5-like [Carya illinoinensis]KAG2707007.1 hypothetical protein I3760_05G127900 [Carya illinoinensis]KAG6712889.1 hypothetical protein I3842_05G123600 [Carya illinoinensis]
MADSSDHGVTQEPICNLDSDGLEAESVNIQCDVNVEDGVNVKDGVNVIPSSSSGPLEPFVGMVFEDVKDAQVFYKAYARRKGFAIRTNHTRLSKDDKTLCAVDYVCTREGFRRVRRKDTDRIISKLDEIKIGCKAIMGIKKDGEKWIVNKFVVGHNHILLTPRSTSFLRGHKGVTKVQKKLLMTLNEFGVPTRNIMSVLSKDSGGNFNVGCIGKDVENYLRSKSRKVFEEGAQKLYSYFLDRQLKEPGFVFSMQVDKDGCMRSCF